MTFVPDDVQIGHVGFERRRVVILVLHYESVRRDVERQQFALELHNFRQLRLKCKMVAAEDCDEFFKGRSLTYL